jgi:hypothetical protein
MREKRIERIEKREGEDNGTDKRDDDVDEF